MSFKTTIYGKYFLLDRIAVGGMAEVFKAKTFGIRGFERLLVIKRILPHLSKDEEFVEMFIDEAKIAVELSHANICQVTDLGKIGDNYFIAMEHIDGKDFRAVLKKCFTGQRMVPVPHALYVVMEAAKGLDYAHAKHDTITGRPLNLVHRDISPQNIMVSYHGEVKIVDFGIAKTEFKLGKTQAGVLKGKFGYMSPEQAAGLDLDARTDVFSLGIILYEALTGRRLFLGENDLDTLEKIKECAVPPPRKYNSEITPELETVVLRALAKNREDRFSTAAEFHQALSRIFYLSFPDFSVRDLSDFLRTMFAGEIEQEQEALRRAVDALPKDEIAAVTDAAERAGDRLVESGPHRIDTSSSPSGPKFGLDRMVSGPLVKPAQRFATGSIFKLIAGVAITVGAFLAVNYVWKLLQPGPAQPTRPKDAEMVGVNVSSDPPGASLFVNEEKADGETPIDLSLEIGRSFTLRFDMDGYRTFEKVVVPGRGETRFGPYRLERRAPESGKLTIISTPPGASILVDGRRLEEKTPLTLDDVPLNESRQYGVEMAGYETVREVFALTTSNDTLDISLAPRPPQRIKLRVVVSPQAAAKTATVFLDGRERGREIYDLDTGEYTLKVAAEGFNPYEAKRTFTQDEELRISLEKIEVKKGTISVGASPWAEVFIDGVRAGYSPIADIELPVGSRKIRLENPDFRTQERNVVIREGKNPPLIVDMADTAERR